MVSAFLVEGPAGQAAYWWQDAIILVIIALMLFIVIVQINVHKETGTRRAVFSSTKWLGANAGLFFRWIIRRHH